MVDGDGILLLGWHGDAVHDALALLLTARGIPSTNEGVALRTSSGDQQSLSFLLARDWEWSHTYGFRFEAESGSNHTREMGLGAT